VLCVVDGLGHGESAERAAQAAMSYVARNFSHPLRDIFAGCNLAIRHTRGVVMGIAVVDKDTGALTYTGVGNTRALIVKKDYPVLAEGSTAHLFSNSGVVGGGYRKFRTLSCQTMPLSPGDLVIMYTDGVPEMMDVSDYEDTLRMNVQRLAKRILQDWGRATDDADRSDRQRYMVFRNEGT